VGLSLRPTTEPAGMAIMPIPVWATSLAAPLLLQNWRSLLSLYVHRPRLSAPFVIFTLVAGQSAAAWSGALNQPRHELQ